MRSARWCVVLATGAAFAALLHGSFAGTAAAQGVMVRAKARPDSDSVRVNAARVDHRSNVMGDMHTVLLVNFALEEMLQAFRNDSLHGRNIDVLLRQHAATFRSLQQSGASAVYSISNACAERPSTSRAYVGFDIIEFDASARRVITPESLPYPKVLRVETGSPAAMAGIDSGDVIISADGVDLRRVHLDRFVTEPGRKLNLSLDRDGRPVRVTVELAQTNSPGGGICDSAFGSPLMRTFARFDSVGSSTFRFEQALPAGDSGRRMVWYRGDRAAGVGTAPRDSLTVRVIAPTTPGMVARASHSAYRVLFGATFANASLSLLQRRGAMHGGVSVLTVQSESIAARAGLMAQDVVVRVGRTDVASLVQLDSAFAAVGKAGSVELDVMRDMKPARVVLQIR